MANANGFEEINMASFYPSTANNNETFIEKLRLKVDTLSGVAKQSGNESELDRIIRELQMMIDEEKRRMAAEQRAEGNRLAAMHMGRPVGIKKVQTPVKKIVVGEFYSRVNLDFDTKLKHLIKGKNVDNIHNLIRDILSKLAHDYNLGAITSVGHKDQAHILTICVQDIKGKTGDMKKGASRLNWMIRFYNASRGGGKRMSDVLDQLRGETEEVSAFILDEIDPLLREGSVAHRATVGNRRSAKVGVGASGGGKKKIKKRHNKKGKKTKKRKC